MFYTIAKRYHLCLPTQMNLHPLAWAQQKNLIPVLLARSSLHFSNPEALHLTLPETILSIINILNLEKYQTT